MFGGVFMSYSKSVCHVGLAIALAIICVPTLLNAQSGSRTVPRTGTVQGSGSTVQGSGGKTRMAANTALGG